MTTQAENAIRETAWYYRDNEFTIGDKTYGFVRPVTGRKADHLMVQYPEGGLSTVKERWKDFEGRYKIGNEFLLKSEIITRFGLEPVVSQAKPTVSTALVTRRVSATDKVTDSLRQLRSCSGSDEFMVSKAELAEVAGVSKGSVYQTFKKLERAGVITAKGTLQGTIINVHGVL